MFNGDAYGTVILPNGTFTNCLRVKYIDQSVDSTDLGLGIFEKAYSNSTNYVWLSPDHPGPIATYQESESFSVAIVPPLPPDTTETTYDTTFSWDQTAVSSAVAYFHPQAFNMQVSPNPFLSEITVNYSLEKAEELTFEIQTISGQSVYRQKFAGSAGKNMQNIPASDIPPGSYIAILFGDKQASVQKIIKAQ